MKFVDRELSDVLLSATDPMLDEGEYESRMDMFFRLIESRRTRQREMKPKIDEAKANHPLRKAMEEAKTTREEIIKRSTSQTSEPEK
jgi:hypothetical protein